MSLRGLRGRVLAYLAFAAIASCALTVGFGVVLVRHRVADQQLRQLRALAGTLAYTGGHPVAQGAGTHVYRVDVRHHHLVGAALAALVEQAIGSGGDDEGTIHVRGQTFLYVARQTAAGRIVLLRRAAVRFAQWKPFLEALLLAGIAGALLAVVLAFVLARRLTRPIDSLAAATARVAHGEAGVSVPVSGDDELAQLGQSFNAMSAQLTRAREEQRTFLESVSHELKTPLTSVRGYAEALADDAIGADEAAAVIAAEAERLQRLVADLLDLARLGRADFAVEHAPVDLAAVAAAVVTRHAVRARGLGVDLSATSGAGGADAGPAETGAAGAPAAALGDEGRVLQACSNLVENALRLTPAGGAVTVSAAGHELSVADTGPGLDEQDIAHAFERFYLYDRYKADPGRAVGSGLGLAIVAQLATAMGGSVRAANLPQGGALFTISLPAAAPSAPAGVPG